MVLEVCANSFESALTAQKAGAHRIELCQELSLGGITPSHGLIEKVVQKLEIPVFVLIRPRSGDFTYSESEFHVMLRNIAFAKKAGVQGIVSGVLNTDNTIDKERTQRLIKQSTPLPFTFHRAFDWTPDASSSLEILIDLGIQRVLTSGQAPAVMQGSKVLKSLLIQAANRIIILPGGGVSSENIEHFKENGFKEVHGSFSRFRESENHRSLINNISGRENHKISYSDYEEIKKTLEKL